MTAGKTILLVEDDPVNLKLMRDALQAHGYGVESADNGMEAVDRAVQLVPDLIVMDMGLPGIDGAEATRRLKAAPSTRAIPVIAVTAHAMPGDEERIRAAGCDAYLPKPLRFAEFVRVVGSFLTSSSG